jgi:glyoxylate reductase
MSFDDLIAKSDFLIITVAVTGDAKGKFNKEILSKMKQGSILINTARLVAAKNRQKRFSL